MLYKQVLDVSESYRPLDEDSTIDRSMRFLQNFVR
jgi:hypothetical protein